MDIFELVPKPKFNIVYYYYVDYSYVGGFDKFGEEREIDFELNDMIGFAEDEYNVEGEMIKPGLWIGYSLGDVDISCEEDECGKYLHQDVSGYACVISEKRLDIDDLIFEEISMRVLCAACDKIEEATEAQAELEMYNRDSYFYYGVSQSDFI